MAAAAGMCRQQVRRAALQHRTADDLCRLSARERGVAELCMEPLVL